MHLLVKPKLVTRLYSICFESTCIKWQWKPLHLNKPFKTVYLTKSLSLRFIFSGYNHVCFLFLFFFLKLIIFSLVCQTQSLHLNGWCHFTLPGRELCYIFKPWETAALDHNWSFINADANRTAAIPQLRHTALFIQLYLHIPCPCSETKQWVTPTGEKYKGRLSCTPEPASWTSCLLQQQDLCNFVSSCRGEIIWRIFNY